MADSKIKEESVPTESPVPAEPEAEVAVSESKDAKAEGGGPMAGPAPPALDPLTVSQEAFLTDPYTAVGWTAPEWWDLKAYTAAEAPHKAYDLRREKKWDAKFGEGKTTPFKKSRQMKRWFRKGIPLKYRGRAWMEISGANALKAARPAYYDELKARTGPGSVTTLTNAINPTNPGEWIKLIKDVQSHVGE